jgi:hypothetical protein
MNELLHLTLYVLPALVLMAGAEALLLKPLGRGDVARTLEDNGVALPSDARRL